MDEETKGTLRLMTDKLDELLTILKRIEERQIIVREEIKEEIKEVTPPETGSWAARY